LTYDEAKVIFRFPTRWGDTYIESEDARALCKEAEELSKGLSLATTQTRTWYEDTYEVAVPDYAGVAMLIARIRAETAKRLAQPKSRTCDDAECGDGYGCICYTR
jgi:hypothetical protein